MKNYNYLQAIVMSFYAKRLYKDVANNWGKGTILYMLLLLSLSWLALTIRYQPQLANSLNRELTGIVTQIPTLVIKDGKLETPENKTYIIKSPSTRKTLAVIDTRAQPTMAQDSLLFVTQHGVVITNSANNKITRTYQFRQNQNLILDAASYKKVLEYVVDSLWLFILPLTIIISLCYRLVQAMFFAALGKLFAYCAKQPLQYTQLIKLALLAMTPAIVLATLLSLVPIVFPYAPLCFFFLTLAYLIFAIRANRQA